METDLRLDGFEAERDWNWISMRKGADESEVYADGLRRDQGMPGLVQSGEKTERQKKREKPGKNRPDRECCYGRKVRRRKRPAKGTEEPEGPCSKEKKGTAPAKDTDRPEGPCPETGRRAESLRRYGQTRRAPYGKEGIGKESGDGP